jgi:hypothetical protein
VLSAFIEAEIGIRSGVVTTSMTDRDLQRFGW